MRYPGAVRLTTIPFSHYCEKARWALDHAGADYVERRVLPGFHVPAVAWDGRGSRGRWDKAGSPYSTPLLRLDDGTVLRDSAAIVRWAAGEVLVPSPEVGRVEAALHDTLGVWTRWLAYRFLLDRPELLVWVAEHNVGAAQAGAFRVLRPLLVGRLRAALGIDPARTERVVARIFAALDDVEARAAGAYLVGDWFTAADLALACMLAPLVLPPAYGASLPPPELLPDGYRALVERARAHPAGDRALRLFADHRARRG